MKMDRLTERMGSEPILSVKRTVTIDTMLSFDGHREGTCKQTLTVGCAPSAAVAVSGGRGECPCGVYPGKGCAQGYLPGEGEGVCLGVSTWASFCLGRCLSRGCLPSGVCLGGWPKGGCLPRGLYTSPVDRMTDAVKSLPFCNYCCRR